MLNFKKFLEGMRIRVELCYIALFVIFMGVIERIIFSTSIISYNTATLFSLLTIAFLLYKENDNRMIRIALTMLLLIYNYFFISSILGNLEIPPIFECINIIPFVFLVEGDKERVLVIEDDNQGYSDIWSEGGEILSIEERVC